MNWVTLRELFLEQLPRVGGAESFQLKTFNVGANYGVIASRGGTDADHVDFARYSAVRVFSHVHHHRGDRLEHLPGP